WNDGVRNSVEQVSNGARSIGQNSSRKNAQIKRSRRADTQANPKPGRDRSHRRFVPRFSHVHHNYDSQVVVRAHRTIEQADDCEPNEISLQRGTEYVELGEEATG